MSVLLTKRRQKVKIPVTILILHGCSGILGYLKTSLFQKQVKRSIFLYWLQNVSEVSECWKFCSVGFWLVWWFRRISSWKSLPQLPMSKDLFVQWCSLSQMDHPKMLTRMLGFRSVFRQIQAFWSGRKGMFFIEKWIFSQNGTALKSVFFTSKNASGSV